MRVLWEWECKVSGLGLKKVRELWEWEFRVSGLGLKKLRLY